MNRRLIKRTAEGFCRAFYQSVAVLRLIRGILKRSLTHADIADAKRKLERNLRDSGIAKSDAVRISGTTLCRFKRFVEDEKL